ncbi:MAG: cation-translocating P-type ATPase, partial [Cetobacterium sp.]
VLLNRVTSIKTKDGVRNITEEDKQNIIDTNMELSQNGLRVLAFAYKDMDKDSIDLDDEKNYILVGLVAMIDPPREEVKDAIVEAKKAGIKPIMITGDHKTTAAAIARNIGIMESGDLAFTGQEIDEFTDDELMEKLEKITVYARVSPENKIRIVRAWQQKGKITAMTGDGVNDAPALKQADIGIAMGTGTDVAKDASAMILTDDNFASIVHAIEVGRSVYSNIKKAVGYLFAGNLGAIIAIIFALLIGWESPFTALQLLFINLVNDSLPAIALGLEKPEPNIMLKAPRDPKEPLFAGSNLVGIIFRGSMIGIAVIIAQYIGGVSMAFTTVIFARILQTLPARSTDFTTLKIGVFSNKYVVMAMAACFMIYSVTLIPILRPIFKIPMNFGIKEIGICLGLAFAAMILMELEKVFGRNENEI